MGAYESVQWKIENTVEVEEIIVGKMARGLFTWCLAQISAWGQERSTAFRGSARSEEATQ